MPPIERMRAPALLLLSSLIFALAFGFLPRPSAAQGFEAPAIQSGSDLLGAVNALRVSHGLPAYNANSILMGIAQAQADYLAATGGSAGHIGPGGTSPIDRAIGAGYAAAFFSENWQSGSGLSPSGAVSAWQGDSAHLNTMLSASLVDAGAGVSKKGSVVYYVLDAGATGSSTGGTGTGSGGTALPAGTPKPSQFMVPVEVNTPGPDGLVYHEVAYGQSLWSIAIAYGTKIEAIQALNNLPDTSINVGQKLLILKGPTPVPATPTALLTSTPRTGSPTPTAIAATATQESIGVRAAPTAAAPPSPRPARQASLNLTALIIIGAALLFAVLGTWMGTRRSP